MSVSTVTHSGTHALNLHPRGYSTAKHMGGGGLARRSESKPPKYLSKNSNIKNKLKPYLLNIPKVQAESSEISNLGQIFIFTENCTPTVLIIHVSHFSYPLTIVQINIFEEPHNIFSQPKSQTPNYRAIPSVFLTIECPPPPLGNLHLFFMMDKVFELHAENFYIIGLYI